MRRRQIRDYGGEASLEASGCLLGLLPLVLFLVLKLDYMIIALAAWMSITSPLPNRDVSLAEQFQVHTAFVILAVAVIVALWWGLQQIRILGIQIFKIIASAITALLFTLIVVAIAEIDTIWAWVIGVVSFIVIISTRVMNDGDIFG